MGAMGIPGGSNFIFPRLYHHTFVVAVDSFEDSTIIKIFTAIGDWHFAKGYVEKVALLSRVCTTTIGNHTHTREQIDTFYLHKYKVNSLNRQIGVALYICKYM